jgi:hypothetical protein
MTHHASTQSVHLVVEAIDTRYGNDGGLTSGSKDSSLPVKLKVPPSHAFLVARPGELPHLQETPPATMENVALLETLRKGNTALRLLAIVPEGAQPRVNGVIAPRVSVLHERDQFQFTDASSFHVTLYNDPRIGAPRADSIGKKSCAVCTKVFEADSKILECVYCESECHLEGEAGLDCANLIANCPICAKPLVKTPSYTFEPAL